MRVQHPPIPPRAPSSIPEYSPPPPPKYFPAIFCRRAASAGWCMRSCVLRVCAAALSLPCGCVLVRACVALCMRVDFHACVYARSLHTCTDLCRHVHFSVCMHGFTRACTGFFCLCMHGFACTWIFAHAWMGLCMYLCAFYARMWLFEHACMCFLCTHVHFPACTCL